MAPEIIRTVIGKVKLRLQRMSKATGKTSMTKLQNEHKNKVKWTRLLGK